MQTLSRSIILLAAGLGLLPIAAAAQTTPAQEGAVLFRTRCAACHTTQAGARSAAGPSLAGIFRRTSATGAYAFSPALKKARLRWDARTLDIWLAGPSKMVPGTRMFTIVANAEDRRKIIAYLSGM